MTGWRVPDTWTPDERLCEGERLADVGASAPRTVELAGAIRERFGGVLGQAAAVLVVVQALPYVPDPGGEEWLQSVAETWERGGDCEDVSTAVVALARAVGLRARLVWLPLPGEAFPHVSAQISPDPASVPSATATWWWAEPSVRAHLGEYPLDAAARLNHWRPFGRTLGR